jgi:CheY-like chemotaxis protein
MSHEIFLCHSSSDVKAAEVICAGLESDSLSCWLAPRDISAGDAWAAAIIHAITSSRIVLVLLSASANGSTNVANEVHLAAKKKRPMLPVLLEDVQLNEELAFHLNRLHFFNAFPPPVKVHLPRLVDRVRQLLGKRGTARQPTVVVVGDNREVLRQIQSVLAEVACMVIMADEINGPALNRLQELLEPPDLLILDTNIPDMDGIDFLRCFRQIRCMKKVPVIALINKSSTGWEAASIEFDVDVSLAKPFVGEDLFIWVRYNLQPPSP